MATQTLKTRGYGFLEDEHLQDEHLVIVREISLSKDKRFALVSRYNQDFEPETLAINKIIKLKFMSFSKIQSQPETWNQCWIPYRNKGVWHDQYYRLQTLELSKSKHNHMKVIYEDNDSRQIPLNMVPLYGKYEHYPVIIFDGTLDQDKNELDRLARVRPKQQANDNNADISETIICKQEHRTEQAHDKDDHKQANIQNINNIQQFRDQMQVCKIEANTNGNQNHSQRDLLSISHGLTLMFRTYYGNDYWINKCSVNLSYWTFNLAKIKQMSAKDKDQLKTLTMYAQEALQLWNDKGDDPATSAACEQAWKFAEVFYCHAIATYTV